MDNPNGDHAPYTLLSLSHFSINHQLTHPYSYGYGTNNQTMLHFEGTDKWPLSKVFCSYLA